MSEVRIRKVTKADIPFITNSWLKTGRDCYATRGVPNRIYYHNQHRVLDHILPRAMVLVVCAQEDDDQIVGYCVAEDYASTHGKILVFHMLYVKGPFRRMGIAEQVSEYLIGKLKPNYVWYTTKNDLIVDILAERDFKISGIEVNYNPFFLYQNLPPGWTALESYLDDFVKVKF